MKSIVVEVYKSITVTLVLTNNPTSFFKLQGIMIYFFYGHRHSMEAAKPSEEGDKEFVLYDTPDIGQQVTQLQPK